MIAYKVSDLLFAVRIEEASRSSSASFEKIQSIVDLKAVSTGKALVVCDLTEVKGDLGDLTKIAKERNWKILGYHPHVDTETGTLARSLGVNYVVPRSVFRQKLGSLLS